MLPTAGRATKLRQQSRNLGVKAHDVAPTGSIPSRERNREGRRHTEIAQGEGVFYYLVVRCEEGVRERVRST